MKILNRLIQVWCRAACAGALLAGPAAAASGTAHHDPLVPPAHWPVHCTNRPQPAVVRPADECARTAPSDAVVLFDGTDLKQWRREAWPDDEDKSAEPRWKIENGYMEIVPRSGSLFTRQAFGDCQIHIEWATPAQVQGSGQGRGNSGVFLAGHPEIQVLDSHRNATYADGSAAALYGMAPPLVNASRPPGEWQSYDIIYVAPRFNERREVAQPARYTVFHNGILVHHAVAVSGNTVECVLGLQDHLNPVRYRNIWVRPLRGYDAGDERPHVLRTRDE
jgi:hypothetical protein